MIARTVRYDAARDELYASAVDAARTQTEVTISFLMIRLRIGFDRAAALHERMRHAGILGELPYATGASKVLRP